MDPSLFKPRQIKQNNKFCNATNGIQIPIKFNFLNEDFKFTIAKQYKWRFNWIRLKQKNINLQILRNITTLQIDNQKVNKSAANDIGFWCVNWLNLL